MTPPAALWVHVGDPRHGVHRYGAVLAAVDIRLRRAGQVRIPDPRDPAAPSRVTGALRRLDARRIVLQYTDRLWGSDPASAASAFVDLVTAVEPAEPIVVLHDVPRDGEAERQRSYAEVASVASCVVSSEHERRRLARGTGRTAVVVPHFVATPDLPRRPPAVRRNQVAVLGFVYPGKGHDDVIAAAALVPARPEVTALGGAAPGHAAMLTELTDQAQRSGVRFRATGWLGEQALALRASAAAVPVVANDDPSASGSLASWLAVGRRPLVRDSPYAREVDELAPGCVQLHPGDDPELLARHVGDALVRPWTTRTASVPVSLAPAAIAARILDDTEAGG